MSTTLKGEFDTRRQAEMTVERLVQEYGVDRTAIMVAAAGEENSAGVERAGSDNSAGAPSEGARDDAALEGMLLVVVELDDAALAQDVRSAFAEFSADDVEQA
ncbi:MAG: hypothetical protein ACRYGI_21015 [Janthinobacterium lividum]